MLGSTLDSILGSTVGNTWLNAGLNTGFNSGRWLNGLNAGLNTGFNTWFRVGATASAQRVLFPTLVGDELPPGETSGGETVAGGLGG